MPPQRMTGAKLVALAARIAAQVQKRAAAGVGAAAVFLAARLKEQVSVPAPRKRVVSKRGDLYYRATVRAIPGAPPRKLSGKLRQTITYQVNTGPRGRVTALVGTNARSVNNFNYPRWLEQNKAHPHKFVAPTVRRYRADLVTIVGRKLHVRVA